MVTLVDLALPGEATGLALIGCSRIILNPDERTDPLLYPGEEIVYFVTSGYGMFNVASSGAYWDYPVQHDSVIWLSDSAEHQMRNDGASPLECVCFHSHVDRSRQETGKEVQRRIADLSSIPVELEKGTAQRIVFRGSAIGSDRIDTAEGGFAPPGGGVPPHRNYKIEGICYIVRGKGVAAIGEKNVEIKAGQALIWPVGALRFFEAAPNYYLQYVLCSVFVESGPI